VQLILPGQLATHSAQEGAQALHSFENSKASGKAQES